MASYSVRQILGEMTGSGDVPPVMVGCNKVMPVVGAKPARRSFLKKKQKSSTVQEEQSLIPQDAVPVDDSNTVQNGSGLEPNDERSGSGISDIDEPLLGTDLAIVAPDATPNAAAPLNAAVVPQPTTTAVAQPVAATSTTPSEEAGALNTILQKGASSYESIGGQRVKPRLQETAADISVTAPSLPLGMGFGTSTGTGDLLQTGCNMPAPVQDSMASAQRAAAAMAMFS